MSKQRLFIYNGKLIIARPISGPNGQEYDAPDIEYQLYDESGRPAAPSYSYRGHGAINGRYVVIGDTHSAKQLLEATIKQPTEESEQRFAGFLVAIDEKRAPKDAYTKYAAKSSDWWDGYRNGLTQKKAAKAAKPKLYGGRVVR